MVDAVDSLLNNAVDLYIQAVDYCRILTSQIPTPVDAGIRQIKPESGDVRQMSSDSGDTNARFWPNWPERQDLRLPGRKLAKTAGFQSTGRNIC